MLTAGRILQRLASASTSRAITFSARRQPSLSLYLQRQSVRNQPTIGGALCGRRIAVTPNIDGIMAETEQQPQTESQEALEPKSGCTEAVEANEGDKKNEELLDKSQDENQQEGGGLVTPEGSGGAGKGGEKEGTDVDSAKTATELEAEMNVDTAGAASGEAATTTKDKAKIDAADNHRSSEQLSKDKTPPPEDKDINGPKECDQSTSAAAENNPPKQKEGGGGGGIRGFFNASIGFLRRGISLDSGPRRSKDQSERLFD